ncbi:Nn.00g026390.m01.CDS01 [Neocucurbitaria sp. VM-36]
MQFFTTVVASVAVVAPLASAHGVGLPTILGLDVADLKARSILSSIGAQIADAGHVRDKIALESRQSKPECGEGIGSCPAGKCCSRAGYCGTTGDYCYSPGCKYQWGPGCPENNPPSGTNTSSISRDKLGSVPYGGTGFFRCTQNGTVALTYDDGPQKKFTEHILDVFKSYNAKATFFITGNNINKGQIDITDEHVAAIKRMDAEGHQIASHTWTHLDLSMIPSIDRKNQLWMNEMAIRNVVGKIPTYMRPPYSSCTTESGCDKDLTELGYHVTNFNVDTDDYNQNNANDIQKSKEWFKGNLTKNGASVANGDKFLSIGHDILEQTAMNLTEFMLSTLTQLGYKAVTVGECLGDPSENWYRTADGAGSGKGNMTIVNGTEFDNSTSSGGDSTQSSGGSSTSDTPSSATSVYGTTSFVTIALLFSFAFAFVSL